MSFQCVFRMTFAQRALISTVAVATCLWTAVPMACAQNDVPVNEIRDVGIQSPPNEFITDGIGQADEAPPENNDIQVPVRAVAAHMATWRQGETTITTLRGGNNKSGLATLWQGEHLRLAAQRLVVFDRVDNGVHDVRVYAEERVQYEINRHRRNMASHLIRIQSLPPLELKATITDAVDHPDPLMRRAMERLTPSNRTAVAPVAFQANPDPFTLPQQNFSTNQPTPLSRRIQIRPRSSQPLGFSSEISKDTEPREQVLTFTGGVNVLVEGFEMDTAGRMLQPGVLDLSADRVVIWTDPNDSDSLDPTGTGTLVQSAMNKFQVYLEGNILVRQGQNTVTATHAFYDANNDRALLMNAELRAFLPQTGGVFRIRAERLRQTSENRFHAQNAWTTTSPYGKPGYRLQAKDIFVEPGPASPFTELDPITGLPANGQPLWVTALDSQFMIGDVPVLSLPRLTAPAEDPNIPLRRAIVKHDRVFGLQVKTVWDLTKILGQKNQRGMQWDLLADYLSERGPALGVEGDYDVQNNAGRAHGNASFIWQMDHSEDNLGLDRRSLDPEDSNRGQVIWRHKQHLPADTYIFGEIGFLSDRNYRESFHETEFDRDKDAETLLGIRRDSGLWSGMFWGKTELNDFEASTDWLPRADLYGFSQPLFNGLAYYSTHSSAGYADLQMGEAPTDPTDPYTPLGLPYVQDASGLVAKSRHQIDAPFNLGPVTINPFVMGEAAFWNQGLQDSDIDRYVLSGGVQANLSATKIMPFFRSDLWNLNGLAHKSNTFLEYRITDVSRGMNEIAQYNEIDENNIERIRARNALQSFGGIVPAEFNPRNYALRNGAGLWISSPIHEIVDDQEMLRLRWRNRIQTKVGPIGQERIRDVFVWETGATWFPNADRDNFGEDFGMIYGNYRWNVNDRTSLLADGIIDLFDNSQDVWSVGVLSQRSTRGSMYLGFRQVEATNYVDSQTLVASYSYQMSPKWISTASLSYDVAESESRGSSLTFSRVGLDWVLHMGFGVDISKDNVGVAFALEPRFGPPSPTNLSYLLGLDRAGGP
ncbi:Organic solvent tolerance protein OstA [Fuerstiella marisgermanici]|uniref:Organic solvent tolerance protein OstA n=2 Tax=Fuerstiella marisgermanici TaxID=1891926 RepID=A0A1P8WI52_9PLAN|nr:Organic solvent tolerance protein OstA [Fuerstiella marisgermanici]